MARPRKDGMDYFPHDTDATNDKKIEALRMLYGNDGYAFYFIILEMIYKEPTFELDVSDAETIQILSKKCGINSEVFDQILKTALKRDCFDRESYNERRVLTSNGIKKRSSIVVEKRDKMRKSYEKRVSDAETTEEMPQSKSKVINKYSRPKQVFDEESIELRIANFLHANILKHKPDLKQPNLQTWAKDIRKLIEIDKREPKEIGKVIEWVTQDTFWQAHILSASKLREKWDTVTARMKTAGYKPTNKNVIHLPEVQVSDEERRHLADVARKQAERNGISPAVNE